MYLTKDSIGANGVLIVKKIEGSPYDHAYVYGCYRFFYALDNGANAPEDLADRNADGVPDYVENLLYKLETARLLLTESFHLKDPLLSGFFHAKGAKFIDVYLNDIPREHGLASGTVFDDRHEILDGSAFQGKSLKLTLHRNLKARTETPLHELFHLFQYNYSQFNNPWFMEGLGRWSQRIISEGSGREEKLPSSADELEALLNKAHEAEYFWNRLSSLCDERGTFVIPEPLRKNDEIANNARPGVKLIKAVLENTEWQCRLIEEKAESRHLSGLAYWPREEKRSLANNQHILLAIFDAIQACTDGMNEELSAFIDTITPLIHSTPADFAAPEIQDFMRALKLCDAAYVKADENGVLYSEHFDLLTRTFSASTLDCSHPALTDADLKTFKVIKRVHGNLELANPNITTLEGWDNLEAIQGKLVLGNTGIEHIDGLNKLKTVNGITLSGMNSLLGISGLNRLATVSGTISIANNPNLVNINGFNSLDEIRNGALEILENGALESLSGFNQLKTLQGDLLISKCRKLATLSGLSSLGAAANILISETNLSDVSTLKNLFGEQKDFPGYIKIIANRITSVSFMRGLKSVASSFYLHQNRLTNLEGLEALENVGASLSLASNRLNNISQLSKLKKIDGVLSLSSNRLTSLHGLERLQSIKTILWNGTPLTIKFQDNMTADGRISLSDISALANVKEVGGHLIIFVDPNHAYAAMPVKGSAYHTNKITYLANRTDETGRMLTSSIEVPPQSQLAPEELRIALNQEPFLAWESAQPERYEFVNGQVFALKEPTSRHVTMCLNIAPWLTNRFRISRYRIHMAHMKLHVESAEAFLYPDVFVTDAEISQQTGNCMTNPLLIVEVLSDATRAYDRGEKFSLYRQIPCLREYVLVDPDTLRVEIFSKNGTGYWELHDLPEGAGLELESLGLTIPPEILYGYL